MAVYLSAEDVRAINREQIARYGGLAGDPDADCVDAALALPRQWLFGEEVYASVASKAAAYLFHLAKKHCFPDGNKRTGAGAALLFLRKNGMYFRRKLPSGQLAKVTIEVVLNRCTLEQLTRWFSRRIGPIAA